MVVRANLVDPIRGASVGPESERASSHREMLATQGIVLAGEHGWGACELTRTTARSLLPIGGRPILTHILSWFRDSGINAACVCANSETVRVRRVLESGSRYGVELDYYEDVMPRGPAGCVRDGVVHTNSEAQTLVVIEGSLVPWIDLNSLVQQHLASGAVLTVVASRSRSADSTGERPLKPVGIYVFSRRALDFIPATGYQDIKEALIPLLHREGQHVETCVVPNGSAPRVDGPESYLQVSHWAVAEMSRQGAVPCGFHRHGDAWIHETARVSPDARLIGPAVIGEGSEIAEGALIVGPVSVGCDVRVERDAVVSRSMVWDRCHIGRMAIIDNCVLTDDVFIEPELVVRSTVCSGIDRSGDIGRCGNRCR